MGDFTFFHDIWHQLEPCTDLLTQWTIHFPAESYVNFKKALRSVYNWGHVLSIREEGEISFS